MPPHPAPQDTPVRTVVVGEMFASHDLAEASQEAVRLYGTGIIAMVPGAHASKTCMFPGAVRTEVDPDGYSDSKRT
jgi:hypothetical protein